MMRDRTNREAAGKGPTRREAIVCAAAVFGGLAMGSSDAWAGAEGGISHTAESIHQEGEFKASRKRVYAALTDAAQFERVVQLSDAMKTLMRSGAPPTQISTEVGGAFSTFGGIIVGRQIELALDERSVQAWRPAHWKPDVYSIVKFELAENGAGTLLVLDDTGIPDGDGQGLLDGWNKNYWEPLAKYLG